MSENRTVLQTLLEDIQQLKNKEFKKKGLFGKSAESQRTEAIVNVIQVFYVPNDKDQLVELLSYLKPYEKKNIINITDSDNEDIVFAFKKRYKECATKAQMLFPDDEAIANIVNNNSLSNVLINKLKEKIE